MKNIFYILIALIFLTASPALGAVPYVGTVTVSCENGATCGYAGDNWHISTDILSANQNLRLTLPVKTTYTIGNDVMTTNSEVALTIKPNRAEITKALDPITDKYMTCYYILCSYTYAIPGYKPSGASSYKTIFYDVVLESNGATYLKSMAFNYINQGEMTIQDGLGNQARLTPRYVIDTGYNYELAGIVYLDDGTGKYRGYFQNSYDNAIAKAKSSYGMTGRYPVTWNDYLTILKEYGLKEVTDIGNPTIYNNAVTINYPGGSVGITGELLIPKAMANTITVRINEGQPRIDSMTLNPPTITASTTSTLVTVRVTNIGSSDDWFTMGIDQTIGDVNYLVNRLYINKGTQGTFTATVRPNGQNAINTPIKAVITASGSYKSASETKILEVLANNPGVTQTPPIDPNQKINAKNYEFYESPLFIGLVGIVLVLGILVYNRGKK